MEFYTQWNRPEKVNYEVNSGEVLVEKAGYISAQRRIENIMAAGMRLVASRKEQYDFENEVDLDYVDITRSKNIDQVDIDLAAQYLDEKAKKAAEDIKSKAKQKDVQKKDIDEELKAKDPDLKAKDPDKK